MKKSLLALSLLALAPFAASAADGVNYNYVEGGYVATNGSGNADANGWGLNGSVAIAPNFHLFGGYSNQEIDNTNIDFDQWRAGVGYNHQISQRIDLLSRVAYEKFEKLVSTQVKALKDKGGTDVAFRVAIKDGKVALTARALRATDE